MITKPTRISTTTATLIDNILVDQKLASDTDSGILLDNTSDHLPCYTLIPDIYPKRKKQLEVTSRDTRPKNLEALKNFLRTKDVLLPLQGANASDQFDQFHETLQNAVDHFLLITTRKIPARATQREAWMTAGLLQCIKKSKRLYKMMLRDRSNQLNQIRY